MISVIIPTYNREKTLPRAIESVLRQTCREELEVIVADDCSTDGTAELVRSMADADPRVRYLCLEKNQGACAARNAGIDQARGEWIAFQDSDDEWLPGKLEAQLAALRESGADVCFHKVRQHTKGQDGVTYFPDLQGSRMMTHADMCGQPAITTQTIIGRREVFQEHRFDPVVRKTQDYDWGIRASRNFRLYYLDEVLVEQYFQDVSVSTQGYRVILETKQYFLQKYADEFAALPSFEAVLRRSIVEAKTALGMDPTEDARRVWQLSRSPKDLLRLVLCRTGLLGLAYKMIVRLKSLRA